MRALSIWILTMTFFAAACGSGDESAGTPDCDLPEPAHSLPDGSYGTWVLESTSGGISGKGNPSAPVGRLRMTLTRDHEIVLSLEGEEDRRGTFRVQVAQTIFSGDAMPFLVCPELGIEQVVELHPNGGMTLSENHYDGFNFHYRRVEIPEVGDPATTARLQLKELETCVELYLLENGRPPNDLAELTAAEDDQEPYIDEIPSDPWGEEYVYRSGRHVPGTRGYELMSKGPDRKADTADDIALPAR